MTVARITTECCIIELGTVKCTLQEYIPACDVRSTENLRLLEMVSAFDEVSPITCMVESVFVTIFPLGASHSSENVAGMPGSLLELQVSVCPRPAVTVPSPVKETCWGGYSLEEKFMA